VLQGDEAYVSGWDLVYDNNDFVEIDSELCGYSTYLGSAMPSTRTHFQSGEDAEIDLKINVEGPLKKDTVISASLKGKSKPK
jgi:hypothetical protein